MKKIIMKLLLVSACIFMFFGLTAGAVNARTLVTQEEGFDYSGSDPDPGKWDLSQFKYGSMTVSDYPSYTDRSLEMFKSDNSKRGQACKAGIAATDETKNPEHKLNPGEKVEVEYLVSNRRPNGGSIVEVFDNKGGLIVKLVFGPASITSPPISNGFPTGISITTGAGYINLQEDYIEDRFYNIKMVFDVENAVFDTYIDGVRLAVNTPFASTGLKGSNVGKVFFSIDGPGTVGTIILHREFNVKHFKASIVSAEAGPVVKELCVAGDVAIGESLVASYTFVPMLNGSKEDYSTYQWMISDNASGPYFAIEGANTDQLEILPEYGYRYLKCTVSPMDGDGISGASVDSMPIGPVKANEQTPPAVSTLIDEDFNQPGGRDTDIVSWPAPVVAAGTVTFPMRSEEMPGDYVGYIDRTKPKTGSVAYTANIVSGDWSNAFQISPTSLIVVEQDIAIHTPDGGATMRLRDVDSFFMTFKVGQQDPGAAPISKVNPGFNLNTPGGYYRLTDTYELDRYYNIKFVLDPVSMTIDFYLDDVLTAENLPLTTTSGKLPGFTAVQNMHDAIGVGMGKFSFDNLKVHTIGNIKQITDARVTDKAGKKVEELVAGETITAVLDFYSTIDKAPAVIYAVLYDENGILQQIQTTEVYFAENGTATGSVTMTLPENVCGYQYRLMVMDSAAGLKPIPFVYDVQNFNTVGISGPILPQ